MNTTRTGKIARLPKATREELNLRLENGESGPQILAWATPMERPKSGRELATNPWTANLNIPAPETFNPDYYSGSHQSG